MAIITTLKTKISIPETIENFRYALVSEDYEECALLKNEFYQKYGTMEPHIKRQVNSFVRSYLGQNGLDPKKDMNNFFDALED